MKAAALDKLLGPGGALSRGLPAYEARPPQLAMARAVAEALDSDARLVVEAGTGTGKTLAYLLPAVLSGRKVVISTGTKTLQEQIVKRDLPLALGLVNRRGLAVASMKGLGNYLCRRKLAELRRSTGLLVPDAATEGLLRWAEGTETGDRAELTELADRDPIWSEVSPTVDSRVGPRCAFYDDCFITAMRRRAAAARVVVVNHHLLLADLALRQENPEASVIPPYEALVLDEAHQLEDIATNFFGHSVSGVMVATLCRDCRRAPRVARDEAALGLADGVERATEELLHLLGTWLRRAGSGGARQGSRVRLSEPPLSGPLTRPYHLLDAALEALAQHLKRTGEGHEEVVHLGHRAEVLRDGLSLFGEAPDDNTILWAERRRRGGVSLHASPVEVGPILRRALLSEPIPMIFTSATLAAGAGRAGPRAAAPADPGAERLPALAYFRSRVGLDSGAPPPRWAAPRAEHGRPDDPAEAPPPGEDQDTLLELVDHPLMELVLPSPFDFQRQTLLYLPRDLPLPNHDRFLPAVVQRLRQLLALAGGRALVLFTSYRNLDHARQLLSGRLPYPLLCQGDRPRSALLEQFRRQVSSVLLATASFWEGVDVVGESLSLVVIDKLPFTVPDDPLTAARLDRLRSQGRSPFTDYQLPQAALSLKQGFGRLIRHRQDRGVVAVLDRRMVQKGYGRYLLRSLPESPRTGDLDRVRAFFEGGDRPPPHKIST